MAVDSTGRYLFGVSYDDHVLMRMDLTSGSTTTIASGISSKPMSVTLSADDKFAFVSTHGPPCYVWKVDIEAGTKTIFAGQSSAGSPHHADGIGNSGFAYPRTILRVGSNLYVADSYSYCIRRIDIETGEVFSDVAGLCGVNAGSGSNDGVGTNARFNHPEGLGASPDGQLLYVGDTSGNRLRKIELATRTVTTLSSGLNSPWAIVTNADGSVVYVANRGGSNIKQIDANTGQELGSFYTGVNPYGLSSTSDGGYAYFSYNTKYVGRISIA